MNENENQLTKSRALYTVKANRRPKLCRDSWVIYAGLKSDDDHRTTDWIDVFYCHTLIY